MDIRNCNNCPPFWMREMLNGGHPEPCCSSPSSGIYYPNFSGTGFEVYASPQQWTGPDFTCLGFWRFRVELISGNLATTHLYIVTNYGSVPPEVEIPLNGEITGYQIPPDTFIGFKLKSDGATSCKVRIRAKNESCNQGFGIIYDTLELIN